MSGGSDQVGVGLYLVPLEQQRGFHIKGLVPGGAAERSGQIRIDDVLTEIEGRDMRAAPIDSVKQMILGAPGSSLRLGVLRATPLGQSQITIVLKRSKPLATTNTLPPPPPLQQQQPQPQAQHAAAREQLSQSRSSFNLPPSRGDNEPSSLYGTRMSLSGDATQCGVGLSLAPLSDGSIAVKAIAAGSSAQLSGRIQVGDILLAVENQPCKSMDIVDLRPLIVGAHETQVSMTFRDPNNRQPAFTLTLKRFTSRPISRSTSTSRVTSMPSSPSRSVQSMSRPGETTTSSEAIGIGAFLMPDSTTGGYLVKSLAGDGAAARSGQIVVGDVVTHVDGCALRQLSLPQVRDLIRGPPEKYVELRIIKKDAGKTATVVIQRRSDNPARPSTAPVKPEPQPSVLSRSLPVSRLGSFDDGANTGNPAHAATMQRAPATAAPPRSVQASAPIPDDHCGVGMMMAEEGGQLKVMGLVPGGPADKSHAIQKGDLLVEIDGKSVQGRSILEVRPTLLGARGSSITIGLARTPGSRPVRITLIRDKPSAAKAAQAPAAQQMPPPAGRSSFSQLGNFHRSRLETVVEPDQTPSSVGYSSDGSPPHSPGESHRVKHERHESAPVLPPMNLGSSAQSRQKPTQQILPGRR